MTLSRGLATPMLGPIHTGGNQLNRRRIHHVDRPLELARKPLGRLAADKFRRQVSQMFIDRPEQLFSHDGVTDLVGVREIVPGGDRKSTRLNSSHGYISYAVFCLKKKKTH